MDTRRSDEITDIRLPQLRVERRAVWWWLLRAFLVWGTCLGGLVAAYLLWASMRPWLITPLVVITLIFLAKIAVEPRLRYLVHRWEITTTATYATTGWIVREWRVAPTSRIQTVDAVRGPLEQLFGLSTLRVTTASSYGAIKISGLDHLVAAAAVTQLASVAELTEGDAT